jgi:hypothetical protein
VDVSCILLLATLLGTLLDNSSIESHTASIFFPPTTASVSNMPYRSSKPPPRCQHKPSSSCALCRREKNDLEQVGAWAREPSAAMAGARSEPTDYASFVQDSSSCCSLPTHRLQLPNTSQPPSSPQPKPPKPHPQPTRKNPVRANTNRSNKGSNLTSHLFLSTLPTLKPQAAASPPPAPTAPSPTVQSQSRFRLRLPLYALFQSTIPTLPDNRRLLLRPNRLLPLQQPLARDCRL